MDGRTLDVAVVSVVSCKKSDKFYKLVLVIPGVIIGIDSMYSFECERAL